MMNSIKKNKIAFYGLGYEADKLLYQSVEKGIWAGIKPHLFFDSYRNDRFWGNKVYRIDEKIDEIGDTLILITSNKYTEIRTELEKRGLIEFRDFIKAGAYSKRLVYIQGNCYTGIVAKYLTSNNEFNDYYYIYEDRPIYTMRDESDEYINNLYKNTDLYLHQDILGDNPFGVKLSSEYAKNYTKKNCIDITFPNLVGMGKIYFPYAYRIKEDREDASINPGFFPFGDNMIDNLYNDGRSIDEIMEYINGGVNEKEVKHICRETFYKFKQREYHWDIKIVDYIEKNYKDRRLFYDLYHPVNEVYEIIVKGIMKLLGIGDLKISCDEEQSGYESPIYYYVRKALNIFFSDDEQGYRVDSNKRLAPILGDREYVQQYIKYRNRNSIKNN